jgi:hypothetical protein
MKGLQVLGLIFFSLIIIAGLMTANGVTGNIIATTAKTATPQIPPIAGYIVSFVGLAGIFTIIALNKKEEDYY